MQEDINPTVGTVNQKISSDLNRRSSKLYSFLELQEEPNCNFLFSPFLIKGLSVVKIRNMTLSRPRHEEPP
jgi:hypothetical protein